MSTPKTRAMINITVGDAVKAELRFVAKVDKTEGCWMWTGATSPLGYGNISIGGHSVAAHRLSWVITHGEIPKGMCVCHRCDTPACVNPDHLFLGTHLENMRDASIKDRFKAIPRGEANHASKLTRADVLEMRHLRSLGLDYTAIGRQFGVGKNTCRRACVGESWAWFVDQLQPSGTTLHPIRNYT